MEKVVVLGMGKSGEAAYLFLKKRGYKPYFLESKDERRKALIEKGFVPAEGIKECSWVVTSPGLPPSHPWIQEAKALGKQIVGEAELALREARQPIVVITGTNGKTTVTSLIEHILNKSHKKARALGNIGIPLTSYFLNPDQEETLIVELSSYQLESLESQVVSLGVILNITPDHLDWHPSMEEYARAKCRIQNCLTPSGKLYVGESVVREFGSLLKGDFLTFGTNSSAFLWTDRKVVKRVSKLELVLPQQYATLGLHESENLLAAWAVCSDLGVSPLEFLEALETFQKPDHRIEFIAEINEVLYFNDSKGTNIDATMKAVQSVPGRVILIAGGVDKGSGYEPWKEAFLDKVRLILLIGEAAPKIKKSLENDYPVEMFSSMEEAVAFAKKEAKKGEVVLLSPGCSSFDMFKDYAHRGDVFRKSVLT